MAVSLYICFLVVFLEFIFLQNDLAMAKSGIQNLELKEISLMTQNKIDDLESFECLSPNKNFYYSPTARTWNEAQKFCQDSGLQCPELETGDMEYILTKLPSNTYLWTCGHEKGGLEWANSKTEIKNVNGIPGVDFDKGLYIYRHNINNVYSLTIKSTKLHTLCMQKLENC